MKVKIGKKASARVASRLSRKVRIRKKVAGTAERPRLCVFRSGKHIYGQIIDDADGKTLVAASSLGEAKAPGLKLATLVGAAIAKKAIGQKITQVVFDRNGYIYHGQIKNFADAAREAGLKF